MNSAKPKTDSPFAARASTRAPFPPPSANSPAQPPVAQVNAAPKSGLPWGLIIGLLLSAGGGAVWWFTRSDASPAPAKSPTAGAPSIAPSIAPAAPPPLPSAQVPVPPVVNVAEQATQLKVTYERLASLASALDLSAQERAAFAGTALAAAQAQGRFDTGDTKAATLRWRDAAQNLGQIVNAKLGAAYEAESAALRGLTLTEYSGPGVLALVQAQAAADSSAAAGDWANASLHRQDARGFVSKAQTEIAAQLNEAARNAATRGDTDLATYFYERALRLDATQAEARAHLYLHKFKAGEITRTSFGLELAYIPPGTFVQGSQPRG